MTHSDTPRTDAMILHADESAKAQPELMFPASYKLGMFIQFCRTLERELANPATLLGKMTSRAKASASRRNGRKGGRPRITPLKPLIFKT